jgi:hypothetical protein
MCYEDSNPMERIEPVSDHVELRRYAVGQEVGFHGRRYKILKHTTLASGEAAVVLSGDKDQFTVGAAQFLAGVEAK